MLTPHSLRLACSAIVALAALAVATPLHADVLLFEGGIFGFGLERYDNAGALVRRYGNTSTAFEESFDHFVLSDDKKTFYVLSNSLGFTNIYPFHFPSGVYAGPNNGFEDYSPFDTAQIGDFSAENAVIQGHHAVIHNGFSPYLTVVSNKDFSGGQPNFASLKYFDLASGDFLGSEPFPVGMSILDYAANDSLDFTLTNTGIYRSVGTQKIINNVPGDSAIIIGPDNRLYVSNGATREVRRYNPNGTLVDAFLTSIELDMVPQSLQFGPEGDLYVLGTDATGNSTLVKRFDGTTSNFVSTNLIDVFNLGEFNSRFYILVPEPAAYALAAVALVGVNLYRRRR